jgi:hypothetical protein
LHARLLVLVRRVGYRLQSWGIFGRHTSGAGALRGNGLSGAIERTIFSAFLGLGIGLGIGLGYGCDKGVIQATDRSCDTEADCRADETCLNEQCVSETCPQTCLPGEATCREGGLSVCVVNRQRCPQWDEATPCGDSRRCVDGSCIDISGCVDECAEGELQCAGDGSAVMACDVSTNGCLVLVVEEDCAPNGQCSANQCVCQDACTEGQTECGPNGGVRSCAGPDADGCLYWDDEVACGAHQECDVGSGQCLCSEECSAGQTECGPNGGVRTCEGPDGDGCTYWSAEEACYPELVCVEDEGACLPDTPEHCYTVNECLYEGQKLCTTSTDYRVCEEDGYTGCLHWSPT